MAEAAAQIRGPLERTAPDTIRLERLLDASPETVWRYLTEAELREQWLMGGTDAAPGGEFEFVVDHSKLSAKEALIPEGYAQYQGRRWPAKVLRFEPPRLLVTTFGGGPNALVTYELFSQGEGTKLVLTHSGIEEAHMMQNFGAGWASHLAVLQEKLAGRVVENYWALHGQLNEAVRKALEG